MAPAECAPDTAAAGCTAAAVSGRTGTASARSGA